MPGRNNLNDDKLTLNQAETGFTYPVAIPAGSEVFSAQVIDLNSYHILQCFLYCVAGTAGLFDICLDLLTPEDNRFSIARYPTTTTGIGNGTLLNAWVSAPIFDWEVGPWWNVRFRVRNNDVNPQSVGLIVLASRVYNGAARLG